MVVENYIISVFVAKYCDKRVYKWTPGEKNNDKKNGPFSMKYVWNGPFRSANAF